MDAEEKQRLFDNLADTLSQVPEEILHRQLGLFMKADPLYAAGVCAALTKRGVHAYYAKHSGFELTREAASLT
jgi:catalase